MQKNKRTGLPDHIRMRHDDHFVDLISIRSPGPRVRMIPLDKIDPNPQQPRNELGNIQELMDSIKSKGVLEPILVRPKAGRYEIIAGERRFVASKNLGQPEIPCIELDVRDNEALEISLIENLQRKDLDTFEESDGLNTFIEIYGYSHQKLSEKIGKARSTITEILSISRIPKKIRQLCQESGITSRSTLIEIAKLNKEDEMQALVQEIQERSLTRKDTRELSKHIKGKTKKEKNYVFNYAPKNKENYRLRIEFKKQNVSKQEIIQILEDIIKRLKKSPF